MQKLHHIKSPALKRAVIGLGLVAAFGAGYQVNEAKWRRLQRSQAKENFSQENIQNLSQPSFNFAEFTPEGVKLADLNAIDSMTFVNPDSAKFAAYRMDNLSKAVQLSGSRKDDKGRRLADTMSFQAIEKQKNKLISRRNGGEYNEDYLQATKAYYDLVCLEVYKASRYGENQDLWQKKAVQKHFIGVKLSVMRGMKSRSAYSQEELEKDFRRMKMAEALPQARRLQRENNKAVAYLMSAREEELRNAFELKKDSLRQALYDDAEHKRQAERERLMRPFEVDSVSWSSPFQLYQTTRLSR